MTDIPNYDQEIERRYHPENFLAEEAEKAARVIDSFAYGKTIKIKKSAKRGSAKEARSIQHKKRGSK